MNVKDMTEFMSPTENKEFINDLVTMFETYETQRGEWNEEIDEVAQYVYATDTRETTNSKLPFHNSTTIPKLAQIRSNLIVSYSSQLMPNSQWIQFKADSAKNDGKDIRASVEGYVRSKSAGSGLEGVVNQLVTDWVDTGVCAVQTRYCTRKQPAAAGAVMNSYSGPEAIRLDPRTIFWDATASSMRDATKVVKQVMSLGDLKRESLNNSGLLTPDMFLSIKNDYTEFSRAMTGNSASQIQKQFNASKMGSMIPYYSSNTVELLTFYGTFYNMETDELFEDYRIVVCNRKYILSATAISEYSRGSNIHISIYETRHGCLAPIGPLARIVGLQYKVDKLENLRADAFDKMANPPIVEIGDVEFYGTRGAPGCRYKVIEGGDVKELTGSTVVLNADMQIMGALQLMDELSGNPKLSVGSRTPGEKTRFEVQLLDNGENRSFRYNMRKFEHEMLNPILNDYLMFGRVHLDGSDIIEVFGADPVAIGDFVSITKEQLSQGGSIRAMGASIFSEKGNILQTLTMLENGVIGQMLNPHTDRMAMIRAVNYLADIEQFELFFPNIGVQQMAESQSMASKSAGSAQASAATGSSITPEGQ